MGPRFRAGPCKKAGPKNNLSPCSPCSSVVNLLLLSALLSTGCAEEPDPPPIVQPPPMMPADPLSLTAEAPAANGPAIWLEGTAHDDGVQLDVRARSLGSVAAWAFTLRFDDQLLSASDVAIDETALGAARHMVREESGALIAGGVRTPLENTAIDGAVKLAHLTVRPRGTGTFALRIERAVARDAGGAYVPIAASGASIVSRGGAR